MRILIFGANGMLGHRLLMHLSPKYDVRATLRQSVNAYEGYDFFDEKNIYYDIDVRSVDHVANVLNDFRPHAVVNAVGLVKQRDNAKEIIPNIEINALFPHKLAHACGEVGARLLHMSTDCVFSVRRGNYKESDIPDAVDLYGRTKLLGEVRYPNCLTLRSSIIGPELTQKNGLLEWFLSQKGRVHGFKNAIFSGFTTMEMSRIIEMMIVHYPETNGLYHVSSNPISKYDLLVHIKSKLKHEIEVLPDDTFICDRSLDSSRFRGPFGYEPPSWEMMIDELAGNYNELLKKKF